MIIGSYLSGERLDVEYKEFCLKLNIYEYYSKQELRNMIDEGKFVNNFNGIIMKNIKKYLSIYVPKYSSAFHNSKKFDKYELYIGIDDYNEVTGIPFDGNLKKYRVMLQKYVNKIIQNQVFDNCCVDCTLHIEESKIDMEILDDIDLKSMLRQHDEHKKQYEEDYDRYTRLKKIWVNLMFLYKGKLQDVINNPRIRHEFIEYLEKKNLLQRFPEIFLRKEHTICPENVKYLRKDPNSIVYWLIKYKDTKVNALMPLKPKEPPVPKIMNIEYCLATKLTPLRKQFVKRKIRYFVIKAIFTCDNNCEKVLSYRKNNLLKTKRRCLCAKKEGPHCEDI